jgi:hypothetical protein
MFNRIVLVIGLFSCYEQVQAGFMSIKRLDNDRREFGMRTSLLDEYMPIDKNICNIFYLGFQQAMTDMIKKYDDLAISKSNCTCSYCQCSSVIDQYMFVFSLSAEWLLFQWFMFLLLAGQAHGIHRSFDR